MYLPDTNIFVKALSSLEPEASFLKRATEKGAIRISVVVVAEFLAKANEGESDEFRKLTVEFGVVPINEEIAIVAADYRRQLLSKKKRIIIVDCFLAAQAKLHHLILVTNNRADFSMRDIKVITP